MDQDEPYLNLMMAKPNLSSSVRDCSLNSLEILKSGLGLTMLNQHLGLGTWDTFMTQNLKDTFMLPNKYLQHLSLSIESQE